MRSILKKFAKCCLSLILRPRTKTALALVLAVFAFEVVTLPYVNAGTKDFNREYFMPNGKYDKDKGFWSQSWDSLKSRFKKGDNRAERAANGLSIISIVSMFATGDFALLVLLLALGAILCKVNDKYCVKKGPPTEGAKEPFCPDSKGVPITDAVRASQCCAGEKFNKIPDFTSILCKENYPPQELDSIPSQIAGDQSLAEGEMRSAASLIGPEGADTHATPTPDRLAQGPQGEAATAGGAPGADSAQGSAPNLPTLNTGNDHRPGGGAGAPGAGSGLGSDFGTLRTAPMSDAALGVAGATGTGTGDPGGTYKSGSGGNGTGGGGSGDLFGGGLGAGLTGGAPNAVSFDADMNGTQGATSTSEDPEDYFTRIGLNDNLFKIVERRYRTKSHGWVTDDLLKAPLPKR